MSWIEGTSGAPPKFEFLLGGTDVADAVRQRPRALDDARALIQQYDH